MARKGAGKEARLSYAAHVLMENRNGLAVNGSVIQATGRAEPQAMVAAIPGWHRMELPLNSVTMMPRAEAAEVLRLDPQFNLEMIYRTVGPKGKVLAENARRSADLRKAGLK